MRVIGTILIERKKMSLFDKLAQQESNFLDSPFFSPVLKGNPVCVRINGVILNLKITKPKNFEGWGVFKPKSFKEATFVREPSIAEKQEYFNLFPELRFILCKRNDKNQWFGVPAHSSDNRFKITGLVPIYLVDDVQMFDVISVRFDGKVCWYEKPYEKHSLKNSVYLRESIQALLDPSKLELSGLTQEEKEAYAVAYNASEEAKKSKEENRIKGALSRAGANYHNYVERKDSYTIEFSVDGQRHKSVIRKDDLRVESAGICLSGMDKMFDLQSLVTVIREGHNRHRIVRGDHFGYREYDPDNQDNDYDDYA